MTKRAFDKIAAGLQDAIAYAQGDTSRAGVVRGTIDVKAVRAAAHMSQGEFARTYRLPLRTVQEWEQNRRKPDTGSKLYLSLIEADPMAVRQILAKVG